MRMMLSLLMLGYLVVLSSCSSVINGTTQEITINSNVEGAEVTLNGLPLGTTPVIRARIKREEKYFLRIRKEGYKDYDTTLHTAFDKWFWGNIVIGGLLGSTTDMLTGTTHLLDPNTIYVKLNPVSESSVLKDKSEEDGVLKDFIITSYSQIKKDINNGAGEYLNSLAQMLNYTNKSELLKKLKAVLELEETIPGFAKEVAKLKKK